ncbi:DUF4173 domain-containing protein [Brevibacillus centrosporus]|nr:DUF4173 domain-containing protein [Brevibacillus centrosporus]
MAQTMLLLKRHRQSWYSLGFAGEMMETVLLYTLKYTMIPFAFLRHWLKSRMDRRKYGIAVKILAGIGISLPILLVVLTLLTQADGVFGHLLAKIPSLLFDWDSAEALYRLFRIGLVALLIFGYFYAVIGPKPQEVADKLLERSEEKRIAWDGVILVTILTIINFILLVSFMHLVSRAQPVIYKFVQAMLSLLTICTSFMLFSAYFRLSLYEEAYGYTQTRFLAHAFMIFMFVLFVIAFLKIWRNDFSLLKYYGIAGIAAYVVLNYIQVDAVIAQNNIQRYYETGRIDVAYLMELSDDAIPLIATLREDKGIGDRIQHYLQEKRDHLQKERSWQSFTIARYVAKTHLQKE